MRRPFEIVREPWGTNRVLVMGRQLFSYERNPTYARRFEGLTDEEIRDVLIWQFSETDNGYPLDLDAPKTFNEKLNWLKLHCHDPLMTRCADKVTVRDYIRERVGEKYLVPLVGVYDSPDEIDFDVLPEKFAMKVNWGSGQNIICTDRRKLDVGRAREQLRRWMRPESNHYYDYFEWPYKDIKPKILAERFIDCPDGLPDEFKVFCFNGEARHLYVMQGRSRGVDGLRLTFYDREFKRIPYEGCYPAAEYDVVRPVCLDEMLRVAETLARPFPFVRVDFYVTLEGSLRIGEMTFFPGAGVEPNHPLQWDRMMGDMMQLPGEGAA